MLDKDDVEFLKDLAYSIDFNWSKEKFWSFVLEKYGTDIAVEKLGEEVVIKMLREKEKSKMNKNKGKENDPDGPIDDIVRRKRIEDGYYKLYKVMYELSTDFWKQSVKKNSAPTVSVPQMEAVQSVLSETLLYSIPSKILHKRLCELHAENMLKTKKGE